MRKSANPFYPATQQSSPHRSQNNLELPDANLAIGLNMSDRNASLNKQSPKNAQRINAKRASQSNVPRNFKIDPLSKVPENYKEEASDGSHDSGDKKAAALSPRNDDLYYPSRNISKGEKGVEDINMLTEQSHAQLNSNLPPLPPHGRHQAIDRE